MLNALVLTSFFGFILSKYYKLGPFNPFTLYFGVWLTVFGILWIFQDVYITLPSQFLLIITCVQLVAIFLMTCIKIIDAPSKQDFSSYPSQYHLNDKLILMLQLALLAAMPVLYQKATEFAGGQNIFTSIGYINLRRAFNEQGMDMGVLRYLYPLSFLCCAFTVYYAAKGQFKKWRAFLAVVTALFYAYLATGRTFFLMVFVFTIPPLAIAGKIRAKSLIILGSILFGFFFLVATLTAKGTSMDASLGENISSFAESIHSYLIAPFVALYLLSEKLPILAYGDYSLRFLISVLSAIGLTDPPAPLIKGYEFTPVVTNIYTVYEVYIRDFGVIGFFMPSLYLLLHWWLYSKARKQNDLFIFLYAVSLYPLFTQVLQDQYASLVSTWIQATFWCLLFIRKNKSFPFQHSFERQKQ